MAAPHPVIVVEIGDALLSPLTDLRPACCVRTGALSLLQRLRWRARVKGDITLLGLATDAEAPRAALLAQVAACPVNAWDDWHAACAPRDQVLCVRGSCVLVPDTAFALRPNHWLLQSGSGQTATLGSEAVAASLTLAQCRAWVEGRPEEPAATTSVPPCMLTRPWSVRAFRDAALAHDLGLLTRDGPGAIPRNSQIAGVTLIADNAAGRSAYIHPAAKVGPTALLDCELGPIVVDEAATIRPGAQLIGPCYVGPHATVLERATIRPGTAIGPWCKVNGEVGGTIFQGFSNKAHDGYLGDSFLGEWVNLGAGTTNSNLLNTYGEVIAKANPNARNERTGEQFLGAIIADHVKTAICTRIMTGSVLHVGSMFACSAPVAGCVPGFSWVTDAGAKPYRFDKFLEVVNAAMARRKLAPSPAYVTALQALAAATVR